MYSASSRSPAHRYRARALGHSRANLRGGHRSRNRGAVLVLALLIVAVVTVLAVQFAHTFTLNYSRVEYRSYGAQARYYLLGAEALAGVVLEQDAAETETDNLTEIWAQAIPPFPTDHGLLEARLEDAHGRFNLNSLERKANAEDTPGNPAERFTPAQRRFIRLLQTFEDYPLNPDEAIEITEAVVDWIDEDDEPFGFGGAESLHYSREEPPYEPANQPFNSVSELRLVRHVTPELYRLLEPLLVALPADATLNLNTALPPLLRTINDVDDLSPLDERALADLLEDRQLTQYETVSDFFSSPVLQNVAPNADSANAGYGVTSNYFILHAKASVGEQVRFMTSYLERDGTQTSTLQRRFTSY
ncbi:type II secretion system minor pseudopilin GspK [Gilvimarinus sp. F26214L]|uniref:type II secretion system minor pseudopilin GspK n=1 Tax=Gilvimarinus sp. DZF01 TaxID=3461371 RepID=UPI0040459945